MARRIRIMATVALIGGVCGLAATASAQTVRKHMREYEVGPSADQLALDATTLTAGSGAVFVPSFSQPDLEPQVRVFLGDEVVARGPTGRRLSLPEGRYRVIVGQGPLDWRASTTVDVKAGETTTASGFVGATRITAADQQGHPMEVDYVLVSADGHRVFGPTTTSNKADYGETRTWLLKPGTYRLVPGTNPESARGMAIVIPPDDRVRLRLIVDKGGAVLGSEPADLETVVGESAWQIDWTVGGSLSFGQAQRQLNGFSGDSLRVEGFTELGITYDQDNHVLKFGLLLDQSWFGFTREFGESLPFQNMDDKVRMDLEYSYRIARAIGPYIRTSLRTSVFPRDLTSDGDYQVITEYGDGTTDQSTLANGETLSLMPWLGPLILRQSGGIGVTAWDSRLVGFGIRLGVAAREVFYHGKGRYLREQNDGNQLVLQALDDNVDWGPEVGAWFRLRLGHWLSIRSEFDGFVPLQTTLEAETEFRPVFIFASSAELRLTDWAAVVYRATLHRDDAAIAELQFSHSLTLRFQYAIF
ncbi:MAG: hypothetical protein ACI9OJ_001717 [Myxococcota bacterium]|jgi:hypothetical protein